MVTFESSHGGLRRSRLIGRGVLAATIALLARGELRAHDPNATLTWNREISRIVYARCASCHREGGTSFPLMTYHDVQPRAAAIKVAVLSRQMPPWGAVKGFGDFRNDQGLTQEEVTLITDWVESGTLKGNNPNALPQPPKFVPPAPFAVPKDGIPVSGEITLNRDVVLDGVLPQHVPPAASTQIVAVLPGGAIQPLLWLYEYKDSYRHPFLFRKIVKLPSGTTIRGVPSDATILLLPAGKAAR